VRNVFRVSVRFRDPEGFHQLPAREIGHPGVAHFSGPHEIVQCGQRFLDGGIRIERMQLEQIDVVGAQAAQCVFARVDQSGPRGAGVTGPVTGR
jgi:hypothetical protein